MWPKGGGGNNCSSLTLYSLSAAVSLLSGLHVGGPHADDTHCLSFTTKRRPSNNILPLSLRCFQLQCSGAVRRSDWLQRWTHAAAAALPRPVRALQGGPACEQAGAAEVLHTGCTALLLLLHRCVTWQRCSSPAPPMCPPAAAAQRLLSCFVPNVATGQEGSCCPPSTLIGHAVPPPAHLCTCQTTSQASL